MIGDPFDKDEWIKLALLKGVIRVMFDGVILRAAKPLRGWVQQPLSTHAKSGRVYFQLTFDGVTKSVLVNRVVALALIPNPHKLPQVNHRDGVKANNHPDNLEWSSGRANEQHAHRTGLKSTRGSANPNAKLDAADVAAIRQSAGPAIDQARKYGVSCRTIRDIKEGKTWTHL